jgi:hypothetical protein
MSSGTDFEIADQVFHRFLFEIGIAFDRLVDVVDVSLVMLGMMDFHRLRIDVRFQSIVRIR